MLAFAEVANNKSFAEKITLKTTVFQNKKKIPKLFKRRSDKGGRGDNSSDGGLPPGSTKSLTP